MKAVFLTPTESSLYSRFSHVLFVHSFLYHIIHLSDCQALLKLNHKIIYISLDIAVDLVYNIYVIADVAQSVAQRLGKA